MFRLYPRSCFLNDPTRSKTVHDERKANDKVLSKTIPVQPKVTTNGVPNDSRPTDTQVDLDKLAYAVAKHETASCTKGYGAEYNNCIGLKNGSIAPCKKIGRNRMCIYDTPEESLEAFKKVWVEGYGGGLPTLRMAQVYSGNDRAETWRKNVLLFYGS